MRFTLLISLMGLCVFSKAQPITPHVNAHAHNDYEHRQPLLDALKNGFISVEADVYLQEGNLLVSHNLPGRNARTLELLYLNPIDSLLKLNGQHIYKGNDQTFYLMIDFKTEANATYEVLKKLLMNYPSLLCLTKDCAVRIFLSGNRPIDCMRKEGYTGVGIDGRPDDVGKGYSTEQMPVISDNYRNWCSWDGKTVPSESDLLRIRELAQRIHSDGKKFRLWAIPDNERSWEVLLNAGVDFINTDHLAELNTFLSRKGL